MKIALTSVLVNSPVEAYKFYTETLGFLSHTFIPEANMAIVVSPEDPQGTALLLEPTDNPVGKTFHEAIYQQGLPAIVLGVENVQQEYERLKKLGVVFQQEPTQSQWGTLAVFDDTCGNYIQIHQP